jgi:hypothetical protein
VDVPLSALPDRARAARSAATCVGSAAASAAARRLPPNKPLSPLDIPLPQPTSENAKKPRQIARAVRFTDIGHPIPVARL